MRSYNVKKRGFTLIELLVVISIIALLIAILLPSLARAKELANRAVCSANIRGIIQSCYIYAQSNGSQFPATPLTTAAGGMTIGGAPGGPPAAPTGLATAGAVTSSWYATAGEPTLGDPLSCLWMLVLQGQDTPKSFICPSDPIATSPSAEYQTATGASAQYYYNFDSILAAGTPNTNGQGESYSIAFPWTQTGGVGGWWTDNSGSDVAEVSDMAPSNNAGATGTLERVTTTAVTGNTYGNYIYNSGNHNGDGQNVGFGDDHVGWEVNPYVGQSGDNIFTFDTTAGPGASTAVQNAVTSASAAIDVFSNTPPYDICMTPIRDVSSGTW